MQKDHEHIAGLIAGWRKEKDATLTVGISGSQGSGKTTLTHALEKLLTDMHGLSVAQFSLDDLYKTKAERAQMAKDVHPLFATRTLPGTHDVPLGLRVFQSLKHGEKTAIPFFDKSVDDRTPQDTWKNFDGRPDVILFEGWCVGAPPAPENEDLNTPLNDFEKTRDPDSAWRRAVDDFLRNDYPPLWREIDKLIFIRIPDFGCVFDWRKQQEAETFRNAPENAMTDEDIRNFTGQAERITCRNLSLLSRRADAVLHINAAHGIENITHYEA